MTADGTNTYIIGQRDLAILDPGPDDRNHLAELIHILGGRSVSCILVTHSHKDHSPLAPVLARVTNAPVFAFGRSDAGRSQIMTQLAASGVIGGGEGVDAPFRPDRCLRDGETIALGHEQIVALWTPGHMGNHMCFQWRDTVFTGDHVMGWAPSLVSPPDGDMGEYMASLERLARVGARVFYPGHGAPVHEPAERIAALLEHRRARETAIIHELAAGAATPEDLTRRIYVDLSDGLFRAASRNVLAHLVDLTARGKVAGTPGLQVDAKFRLVKPL